VPSRIDKVLSSIRVGEHRGLEIGALDHPIMQRPEARVEYVDYAPSEELRRNHANTPTVDASNIVHVDHVWGDKTLSEATGRSQFYDYVVASHVIEHVPDIVTWLHEIAWVLRPGGVLSLIVPDKRFTFDRLRRTSDLPELVEAFLERRRKPTPRQVFDNFCYHTRVDLAQAWAGTVEEASLPRVHDDAYALQVCRDAVANDRYIDGHCWVFTADSFLHLIGRLAKIGLLPFEIAAFFPPENGEMDFFITLRRLDNVQPPARSNAPRATPRTTPRQGALPPLPPTLELARPLVARAKAALVSRPRTRAALERAWVVVNRLTGR
jgi:hypothetical protein